MHSSLWGWDGSEMPEGGTRQGLCTFYLVPRVLLTFLLVQQLLQREAGTCLDLDCGVG